MCLRAWSQTLDSLAPLVVARWVTLLATPWTFLANAQRPTSFLTRIQTTTTYNRIDNHRQVRQRTVVKPTRCSSSGCSHRRTVFPKSVYYRFSQMVQCIVPMRRLIYLINWRASKLQMGPRQTAHWYPFDHAQGSNTGTAKWHAEASATPCLASACGNPKGYHRNSHNYSPHGGSF